MVSYKVADANSYILVTGRGVENVKIVKKAFIWPFQKAGVISITPFDFSITLQAMTQEKLQFSLPAVFTIGPENDPEALKKYATLLTGNADGTPAATSRVAGTGRTHVQDIVKGIIEGETRVIVSGMSMEEIFSQRQIFKTKIIENVQTELHQFGLKIYNANVKELQDTPGSEYFKFLSRKAHEGASNQAKIDVANARMLGEIGEAEKKGKTRQEISKIDAGTAVLETERKAEKAKADAALSVTQTNLERDIKLAQIQAERASQTKDVELQKNVELRRAEMELEKRRASEVVKAKIGREVQEQTADASFYSANKDADAMLYKQRQEGEASKFRIVTEADASRYRATADADVSKYRATAEADASKYRITAEADGAFYAKQKEAEGISEMARAYGELSNVLGGPAGLMQYMMIKEGVYEKLAAQNAKAINGLNPKITVWNTGAEAGNADAGATIRNLMQSLPPLLATVQDQTGIRPPNWMAQMPDEHQQQHEFQPGEKPKQNGTQRKMVNGP